ncbi:MAG: hypothetical protein ACE5NG_09025 [bacterium]
MKCPRCNENPMSLIRYIFKFNRLKVNCKNCGAKLRAGHLIRRMFYGALIFGFALGFSVGFLEIGLGIVLLALVVFAIPAEYVAWNYGRYEVLQSVEER